jgi:hypothetical protein
MRFEFDGSIYSIRRKLEILVELRRLIDSVSVRLSVELVALFITISVNRKDGEISGSSAMASTWSIITLVLLTPSPYHHIAIVDLGILRLSVLLKPIGECGRETATRQKPI